MEKRDQIHSSIIETKIDYFKLDQLVPNRSHKTPSRLGQKRPYGHMVDHGPQLRNPLEDAK